MGLGFWGLGFRGLGVQGLGDNGNFRIRNEVLVDATLGVGPNVSAVQATASASISAVQNHSPKALRTHILRLLGPKTILCKAFGLRATHIIRNHSK